MFCIQSKMWLYYLYMDVHHIGAERFRKKSLEFDGSALVAPYVEGPSLDERS